MRETRPEGIPEATLGRLHHYRVMLGRLQRAGQQTVSSRKLGELTGASAEVVRKDLSWLGAYGQRGVGYEVEGLLRRLEEEFRPTSPCPLVILGAGNLGAAVAAYAGFDLQGYRVVAVLDSNPARVGHRLQGMVVRHMRDLPQVVQETGVEIGVLTVPAVQANAVAEWCAAAGLSGLLSFSPVQPPAPAPLVVRYVNFAEQLQILRCQLRDSGAHTPERV
ncbi:MAG: redox-sensing transcriptional repressor Rex [candidate division WS1 bacterium]|nr:redox-sensing transcriptional repressor Rex [candidate division WS1 bacterium]